MTLPDQAIQWVQRVTGAAVLSASELEGGSVSTVHKLTLSRGSALAIKRFNLEDPLDERLDRAGHEAAILELLRSSDIPVPRLVAVDELGFQAGIAAVLMEYVDGSTALREGWLDPMVATIVRINDVDPGDLAWPYERYTQQSVLDVPSWATDRGLWTDAFQLVGNEFPPTRSGFIHRDLHPGNMLWDRGRLVAVIDWLGACIGPLSLDVSHCRANLAMDLSLDVADSFLSSYLEKVPDGSWHPVWEVVDAIDFLPFWLGQESVDEWQWDDRPAGETRARFEEYLRVAMVAATEMR
ncbi:MAG: aminoglycoside phosphotransferase family protein [Actinomycetota bacterium]|nr:aminoglycoside phosphotransferase family protein [Actinomycetota bacterium]